MPAIVSVVFRCPTPLLLVFIGSVLGFALPSNLSLAQDNARIAEIIQSHCSRCHNEETREAGVRLDNLDLAFGDPSLKLWESIQKQVDSGAMPPEDERPQLVDQDRDVLLEGIAMGLHQARTRSAEFHGTMRRLTVPQYRNALRDLLGIEDDATKILPPDPVSKDGFTNNANNLLLSPLLIESYFQIAERMLDAALVDEDVSPTIQHFRMELGKGINREPCRDTLVLGANNLLLRNDDFLVTEPEFAKPFAFRPFAMQRKFRFIEGYQGNDTVRGWRDFDSIYHAVFACMRGSEGYPKGLPYEAIPAQRTIPAGLLLRPAIPSSEIFGESNTYGPHANFKISLRELPERGHFRVKVRAAKYDDGLLLDRKTTNASIEAPPDYEFNVHATDSQSVAIREPGIYQIEALFAPGAQFALAPLPVGMNELRLQLGDRFFTGSNAQGPFLAVRLPSGPLEVWAVSTSNPIVDRIAIRKVDEESPLGQSFRAFESRSPYVGVHVGLRRDCGSTMNPVGTPQRVAGTVLQEFVFEGAIANYPSPDVEPDNVNYLAGIREIGVRSEFTDHRDMPRLLIESIEFEGPYYETWPPPSHQRIMSSSFDRSDDPPAYARDVLVRFAQRAYRRPLTQTEMQELFDFWSQTHEEVGDLRESLRRTLVLILTSPQFLFLAEASDSPEPEELDAWELASKLSFFLWNRPPDDRLLSLAARNQLHDKLNTEIDRMIDAPEFEAFSETFASQWLGLDKLEIVETDAKRFPTLTRDVKIALRSEPIRFIEHAIRKNLPVRSLMQSDTVVVNDVVASYYGIGDSVETGFEFVAIPTPRGLSGGILTQAAILAGLSDGREANPVKRGAWFARRIIATPPEDPPPNVPKLEDLTQLTLRERLERHRSVKGCVQCHAGIDPWGLPFEAFDAGGLRKTGSVDARSDLPTGQHVSDFAEFQKILSTSMLDQVTTSVIQHLTVYAIGRSLTYNEAYKLREQVSKRNSRDLGMRDIIHQIVRSDFFRKK
jgi:hypothetical protein